ncbi:hypothetical protein BC826DRAFT_973543 [Russula brevipes]|nr:hypothetical protein BC826DRAFT_973543 [Russula brevipes]
MCLGAQGEWRTWWERTKTEEAEALRSEASEVAGKNEGHCHQSAIPYHHPSSFKLQDPVATCKTPLPAPTSTPPTHLKILLHHGPQHIHVIESIAFLLTGNLPRSVIGLRLGLSIQAWALQGIGRIVHADMECCTPMQSAACRCGGLHPNAEGCTPMQMAAPQRRGPHPNADGCTPTQTAHPDADGRTLTQTAAPRCRWLHPDADGCTPTQTAAPQCRRPHPNADGRTPMQTMAVLQCRWLHPNTEGHTPTQMAVPQCRRLHPDADGHTLMQTAAPQCRRLRPNTEGCTLMQTAEPRCRRLHPDADGCMPMRRAAATAVSTGFDWSKTIGTGRFSSTRWYWSRFLKNW